MKQIIEKRILLLKWHKHGKAVQSFAMICEEIKGGKR